MLISHEHSALRSALFFFLYLPSVARGGPPLVRTSPRPALFLPLLAEQRVGRLGSRRVSNAGGDVARDPAPAEGGEPSGGGIVDFGVGRLEAPEGSVAVTGRAQWPSPAPARSAEPPSAASHGLERHQAWGAEPRALSRGGI